MSRRAGKTRGFTLIEVIIAVMAMGILVLAMGGTLIFLIRGENESIDHNEAFHRVDMLRMLISNDLRKGTAIGFPAVDGATGDAGGGIQTVFVEILEYDEGPPEVTTRHEVEWRYDAATQEVAQWRRTWDDAAGAWGGWTVIFSQSEILSFEVVRVSSNRLSFTIGTEENGEAEETSFNVGLRNTTFE